MFKRNYPQQQQPNRVPAAGAAVHPGYSPQQGWAHPLQPAAGYAPQQGRGSYPPQAPGACPPGRAPLQGYPPQPRPGYPLKPGYATPAFPPQQWDAAQQAGGYFVAPGYTPAAQQGYPPQGYLQQQLAGNYAQPGDNPQQDYYQQEQQQYYYQQEYYQEEYYMQPTDNGDVALAAAAGFGVGLLVGDATGNMGDYNCNGPEWVDGGDCNQVIIVDNVGGCDDGGGYAVDTTIVDDYSCDY
ncbi:unnamed protein product [Calypogeia fissa]